MRLAQLARKLSVKPTDILEFLATHSIAMENSANTKVEEEHTRLVITHFAPQLLEAQVEELAHEEDEALPEVEPSIVVSQVSEEVLSEPNVEEEKSPLPGNEEIEVLPDVIRAPKVELSGLKVLGKIELPEKKKKEEVTVEGQEQPVEEGTTEKTAEIPVRKPRREKERKPERRVTRNILEEARERERKAAEEKRKLERERKKELRTQNYLKKVQTGTPPVKKTKSEITFVPKPVIQKKEPTSLWGKFVKWLTSY